jgi:hypothetical protein
MKSSAPHQPDLDPFNRAGPATATVAQVSNLLYRRFPIGRPFELPCAIGISYDLQVANPRFGGTARYALFTPPLKL